MEALGYAKKLLAAREQAGKTVSEMADLLGISLAAYYDLESYDEEVTTCLSIRQAAQLFRALKIEPQQFFNSSSEELEPLSLDVLFSQIKAYLIAHQMTVLEFEDSVGWELEPLLKDHSKLLEYDIDALRAICNQIGINWMRPFLYVISQSSE